MPAPTIFENWTWSLPLPGKFSGIKPLQSDVCSVHNPQKGGVTRATLHAPILSAILAYMKLEDSGGSTKDNLGALGTQNKGEIIIAEYPGKDDGIQGVVYNRTTGKFQASLYPIGTPDSSERYDFSESGETGEALFFALLPIAAAEEEFMEYYKLLKAELVSTKPDLENLRKYGAILCDNMYRRIRNAENLGADGIPVVLSRTGNIPEITSGRLKRGDFIPDNPLLGIYKILNTGTRSAKARIKREDFSNKFSLSERHFSEAEMLTIPELAEWYIIPHEVEMLCSHAKGTTESYSPMRNFLLRGPAGAGKTEAAKAMASGFGLPYRHLTCSSDTEIVDLLGQMLPVTDHDDVAMEYPDLPTFQDIEMDPGTAYCKLTGNYKDASQEEVYQELVQAIQRRLGKAGGNAFRFVDSPLVEALEKGYLIEIQEPSCISKPGVLVGLNALLDNCRSMVLPTGKIIRRHPDSIVVITTNVDYAGCREMNQSFLSRLNLKVDVKEPDEKSLVERAMKVTKCSQRPVVEKMVKCIKKIAEKCRQDMITDGSCGTRELINWVLSYMVTNDELVAADYTVVPSATADSEAQAEIISACLQPMFGV